MCQEFRIYLQLAKDTILLTLWGNILMVLLDHMTLWNSLHERNLHILFLNYAWYSVYTIDYESCLQEYLAIVPPSK